MLRKRKGAVYDEIHSSFSFNEGGDSEWLINYLRFIIKARCDQNMSIF